MPVEHQAAEQGDYLPIGKKGVFDISSVEDITKSNPLPRAALIRLVSGLTSTSGTDLAKAKDCWISGDAVLALKLLDTLRGAVGNLGANRFAAATIALEQAIRANSTERYDHFDTSKIELASTILRAEIWLRQADAQT